MPKGIAAAAAMPSMTSDPTIAFQMPPPGIPAGVGRCEKNAQLHAEAPLITT